MKQSLLAFCLFLLLSKLGAQEVPSLSPKQWIQDLNQLERLIQEKHADPFWLSDQEKFSTQVYQSAKILSQPGIASEQGLVELMKVIASLRDGHSSIAGEDRYTYFGYVPMSLEWFEEGFILNRVTREYEEVLGARLLSIEGMEIEEVLEKLRTVIPHANESRVLKFAPYYLHLPGLLYGLGISSSADVMKLKFENSAGKSFELELKNLGADGETEMRSLEAQMPDIPLHRQKADRSYWFSYLEKEKILYLKFNRVSSDKEESIWAFTERLFEFVEANQIEKFVVDIRDNGGGNGGLSAGLWKGIEDNPKINQSGKLFVITGYKTFSAALSFASYLELRTKAIFVGQEACDYLNHPGDSEDYALSNSGIRARLSALYHQSSFFQDERQSLFPDHKLIPSFASFEQGKDEALDFIKAYTHTPKAVAAVENPKLIGTYDFSPERRLMLENRNGKLYVRIEGKMDSPLYQESKHEFGTEVKGLRLSWRKDNSLEVQYPDTKVRVLPKLDNPPPSILGLIYEGNLAAAEQEFLRMKESCPSCHLHKDHALAGLALEVLYDLRSTLGADKARELAKEILKMSMRINPASHDFSKESLKYY